MTTKDFKTLNEAYEILKREIGKQKCKDYAFGCMQCKFGEFLEEFKSLKDFILKD